MIIRRILVWLDAEECKIGWRREMWHRRTFRSSEHIKWFDAVGMTACGTAIAIAIHASAIDTHNHDLGYVAVDLALLVVNLFGFAIYLEIMRKK